MIQEENKLLLNVLKDGLPYGLQLQITDIDKFTFNGELRVLSRNWCRLNIADPVKRAKVKNQTIPLNYIYIKPYLRPLSSMTEKEKEEFHKLKQFSVTVVMPNGVSRIEPTYIVDLEDDGDGLNHLYDWLNAHHFDYRGLIEKGLAIEAPKGMYKINYL